MTLTKFHEPKEGEMRVVGLMSGSGSNLRRIIEFERKLIDTDGKSPYRMVAIFSDNYESNANEIGKNFDIPVITRDLNGFYGARKRPKKDMQIREEFDRETVKALAPYEATVAAYGGYMSIATQPLINAFLGVNVHPADLSIMNEGKRKYTGDHAVRDAILAGEKYIRSTTHIIESGVDQGRLLIISSPLEISVRPNFDSAKKDMLAQAEKENQGMLKETGDWVIFPKTLEYIAQGRYAQDEKGNIFLDGNQIPNGFKLD